MIYVGVISFTFGILLQHFFNFGWIFGAFILITSLAVSAIFWKENLRLSKTIFILALLLSSGILRMSLIDISPEKSLLEALGKKVSFDALISEEPDIRDTTIRYKVQPDFESKSSLLLVAERFPRFNYGDKVKVLGKLDLPKNFKSDNGVEFDYVSYLSKDKIHFVIYRPKIEKIESEEEGRIVYFLYSLKHFLIFNLQKVVPEPNSSLMAGLLFGSKQSLGPELLSQFKNVGLIHMVVLSGYNITIVAYGILAAANYFGKRNLGFMLSIIILLFFGLMVGLGATVIRALVMASIAILARYLGRPTDALRALFIAGFLMIFYNPLTLISDPSFQLSFMATLGLILFSETIYKFISLKISWIPEKFAIREIVSSTFAVQIFILPLLIKMSGQVSIISFLINPIVLPFVPLTMALGAITSALGAIPFFGFYLSWPFGALSYLLTEIIIKIVTFSSSIPFAFLSISSLSNYIVILCYIGYAFLFHRLNKGKIVI